MRLNFPSTKAEFELSYGTTTKLLEEYINKTYSNAENVNIYVSGNRVYTFNKKWRLTKIRETLETWVDSVYESFTEFLKSREKHIRSLHHGNAKWERIDELYLKGRVLEYFGRRKLRGPFDAMAMLRSVSKTNGHLRVRRRKIP